MTTRPIQNNVSSEMAQNVVKPEVVSVSKEMTSTKSTAATSVSAPTVSPFSSRYTYALGDDGRRYVLQLKITLPGGGFNAFA